MRALQNFALCLVLPLAFTGCNGKPYNFFNGAYRYNPNNIDVEKLIGEPVDIDILGFKFLWIEDTLLLVSSLQDPQKLISVYHVRDLRPLYKGLILRGRGPNEFLEASFVSSYTDLNGIKIWLSVNDKQKLLCVDLTRSIIDKKLIIIKEIDLSQLDDSFALLEIFSQNDTSIVLGRIYNNMQISMYNPISHKETPVGWLYSEEIGSRHDLPDLSAGFYYDAQKSILVSGMAFFDQVNFYHLIHADSSFSVSTAKKATQYHLVRQVEERERPLYYTGPAPADDMLIFGYHNGKNRYEYESPDNNFLHIFNWNGKLKRVILLDRPFYGEAFDKHSGYLYGIDSETQDILKYKIR